MASYHIFIYEQTDTLIFEILDQVNIFSLIVMLFFCVQESVRVRHDFTNIRKRKPRDHNRYKTTDQL